MDHGIELDQEVETRILLLESPFGSPQHLSERESAAAWLVANAERSYSLLLARVNEGHAAASTVELLPKFQRAETIPVLERLLEGPEETAWVAGQALAQQPQPEAGAALRRALESSNSDVAVIAASALGTRGDPDDCAALAKAVGSSNARVRYYSVQAAAKLACLKREVLERLAHVDIDADVRGLAAKLLNSR